MCAKPQSYCSLVRILALLVITLLASFVEAERLPLKTFTVADGLAHEAVNKIVRDSRGFLWFCTAGGLSRFDGYSFTNYGTDQGLPHANVTDLLETRSGEYWVATYGGVARFNPKGNPVTQVISANDARTTASMFSVVVPDDLDRRARMFTVLIEDRNGTIWGGTLKGLYRLERSNRVALEPIG
jgi:ligand-binding sensor domain-containing protein